MKRFILFILLLFVVSVAGHSQMKRSAKRGICENNPNYTQQYADAIRPGVSWTYNWYVTPEPDFLQDGTQDIVFAPMCWNQDYDAAKLRSYLQNHPEAQYLLGFNEPNFSSQANMTPAQAAAVWDQLEALGQEFNLKLISPALNFTGERVGGRVWGIDEWLGAFIEEYRSLHNGKDPQMDYIALHCYMNWAGALDWYVNTYLYANDKDSSLRAYFQRNGKKQIMLTEWCAWEGDKDGFVTNVDNQIDQMVQKVQIMEQSENVAGYAWFMGIGGNMNNNYPYYHVFQNGENGIELTELGLVYTYMSSFDTTCWFGVNDVIPAKDYIDMHECQLRHNTDAESTQMIELSKFEQYVDWQGNTITPYVTYQVAVDNTADYLIHYRINAPMGAVFHVMVDDQIIAQHDIEAADGWRTVKASLHLAEGNHLVKILNVNQASCKFNWLQLQPKTSAVDVVPNDFRSIRAVRYFDLNGALVNPTPGRPLIQSILYDDGTEVTKKLIY